MGLEQRANRIAPQEFHIPLQGKTLPALLRQEVFHSEENPFKGEQPDKDLRGLVEKDLPKIAEKDSMSPDGFEPFTDPFIGENILFVNGYKGNHSKDMRLNRLAIERVLTMAHLDGKIVLTSMDPSRTRSMEANPDGSVTGKRFVLFGQKIEKEDREPLYRVTPIGQGWSIEINDKRMMQELSDEKFTGEKLQKEFVRQFNGFVNAGIFEAVRREKLSDEKDKYFKLKRIMSLLPPFLLTVGYAPFFINDPLKSSFLAIGINFGLYAMLNLRGKVDEKNIIKIEGMRQQLNPSFTPRKFSYNRKNFDSFWEYFMPRLEVDKVARTYAFLKGKGRNLVQETK